MVHRFSRLAIAGLIAFVAVVYADDPKCNVSARECDQQIRNMLSGRRYHGATVEERKPGLVIKSVAPKSPAWKAGLRPGDRLIAINRKSVTQGTTRDFKQIVADARENGTVDMIIWRSGAYSRVLLRLEPYTKEQMDKIIAGHLATHNTTSTAGSH
jgi:predicted metalloprotease with PDZ domain